MSISPTDILTAIGTLANIGLLSGIFLKLGGFGQSIVDILRRLEKIEQKQEETHQCSPR